MADRSDDAVQVGRFSLKEVESDSNGSDLTTKRHDRERRNVLMTLMRLRYTRGRGNAVSTASEGQSAAVLNAVVITTWLKPRSERPNLWDPGGCELAELGEGCFVERDRGQHASIALVGRQTGDMSNWALSISELQFGWRRGCCNNGRTEDAKDTSEVRGAWVASRVRMQIGLEKKPPSAHDDDWTDLV